MNELLEHAKTKLDSSDWRPPDDVENPKELLYELELHRVELDIQNQEVRRRRDQLERSLDRFQKLYDLAPVSLLTLDENGNIVDVNAHSVQLLGRGPAELVGEPLSRFLRAEDAERYHLFLRSVVDSDEPRDECCVFTRTDRSAFRARLTARTIEADGDSQTVVALADLEPELAPVERLAKEVVAHRQSRSELAATRTHLGAIVESALDAIVTFGPEGTIDFANPATEELFGYQSDDLVGKNVRELLPDPDGGEERVLRRHQVGESDRVTGVGRELEGQRQDGTTFPVYLTVVEMDVEGDKQFTGTIRDLTERKRLEKQVVQSQRMEAIGTLASGVAHDFNNLIMGIAGCLELATRTVDPENPAQKHLDEIRGSLQSGAAIAGELLTFARRGETKHPPCCVDDVVLRVRGVFGPLLGEEISLETDLDAGDELVRADAGQLEQMLLDLVINARDAMPRGGTLLVDTDVVETRGPIAVAGGRSLPRAEYVRITVADTGEGMDEETRGQIFEPFFTTKSVGSGTGLGLSMVFGAVNSLGGGIVVDSEPGVGTTFEVFIPVYEGGPQAQVGDTLNTAEYASVVPAACTALVVEDDRLVAQTVKQQLLDRGHNVVLARSVGEAVERAANYAGSIDVVIADSVLPDGFGSDVARGVTQSLPNVGIIFMSAHGRDALLRKRRVFDDQEFLQKPFDGAALQRAIVKTLGRAAHRRVAPRPRRGRVMVVDGHATSRTALALMLEYEGYEVIEADSLKHALEHSLDDVALLVADVRLPDGVGPDLAREIRDANAELEVIYCSGLTRELVELEEDLDGARFFQKPYDVDELLNAVAELVVPG